MNFFSFITAAIAGTALSIESYLNLYDTSLCKTSACEVVGHYLKIGEPLFVAFGAAFFFILALLIYLARRYSNFRIISEVFFIVSLTFDGTIIGFQFFIIQQKCLLCISVAAFLITSFALFVSSNKKFLFLFLGLLCWMTAFSANSILKIPAVLDTYRMMSFYSINQPSQGNESPLPQITFIFSINCPHCLDVINYLSTQNKVLQYEWRFATIDQDKASLQKIDYFIQKISPNKNPFILLSEIKSNKSDSAPIVLPNNNLQNIGEKTISFLSNANINSIPVVFIEEKNKKEFIIGSDAIIDFFKKRPVTRP